METCKYGSGAGKRKPTAVKRKGVVCRAYRLLIAPNATPSTASNSLKKLTTVTFV